MFARAERVEAELVGALDVDLHVVGDAVQLPQQTLEAHGGHDALLAPLPVTLVAAHELLGGRPPVVVPRVGEEAHLAVVIGDRHLADRQPARLYPLRQALPRRAGEIGVRLHRDHVEALVQVELGVAAGVHTDIDDQLAIAHGREYARPFKANPRTVDRV